VAHEDRLLHLSRARACLQQLGLRSPDDVLDAPYPAQAAMRAHYGLVSRIMQGGNPDALLALFRSSPAWHVATHTPPGRHRLLFIEGESEPFLYEDDEGERAAWRFLVKAVRGENRQL